MVQITFYSNTRLMSSSALLLVIAAAIAHAAWNLLAKRAAHVGSPFVFA
jgi:hypothetical protein